MFLQCFVCRTIQKHLKYSTTLKTHVYGLTALLPFKIKDGAAVNKVNKGPFWPALYFILTLTTDL